MKSYLPRRSWAPRWTAAPSAPSSASPRTASVPVGATVTHQAALAQYAGHSRRSHAQIVDPALAAPAQAYLGALGSTGLTAYAGLTEIAQVVEGDVVFVSAPRGRSARVAGQIARKLAALAVVGSAGSEAGEDQAADRGVRFRRRDRLSRGRRRGPTQGRRAGRHRRVLRQRRRRAPCAPRSPRPRACGGRGSRWPATISPVQRHRAVPGPVNLGLAIGKRLTMRGLHHHRPLRPVRRLVRPGTAWHGTANCVRTRPSSRASRPRGGGVPRRAARRQHRQDADQGLTGPRPRFGRRAAA